MFRLFHRWSPGPPWRERALAGLGCALAITGAALLSTLLGITPIDLPLLVAPIGASAVLVLAVRASPLAQPWPVIGGNMLSTLVGVLAWRWIPDFAIAAGVAVGGAVVLMMAMRCLHPPGGAAALGAVIGGGGIHDAGFAFAVAPVGVNSLAVVGIGLLFHRLAGQAYPHAATPAMPPLPGIIRADLDAALAAMDGTVDIVPADLADLMVHAERHAAIRSAGTAGVAITGDKARSGR